MTVIDRIREGLRKANEKPKREPVALFPTGTLDTELRAVLSSPAEIAITIVTHTTVQATTHKLTWKPAEDDLVARGDPSVRLPKILAHKLTGLLHAAEVGAVVSGRVRLRDGRMDYDLRREP